MDAKFSMQKILFGERERERKLTRFFFFFFGHPLYFCIKFMKSYKFQKKKRKEKKSENVVDSWKKALKRNISA